MPTLRDAVKARMPKRRSECAVCAYLRTLPPKVRAEWEELLAEPNEVISANAIAGEMTERIRAADPEGKAMHYVSVTKHRDHD